MAALTRVCWLAGLVACTTAAPVRGPEQPVREQRRPAATATELQERLDAPRLARFAEWSTRLTAGLAVLQLFDELGDTPGVQLRDIAAAAELPSDVSALAALCREEMAPIARRTDDTGQRVHRLCSLAVRARPIVERQYLAVAQHRVGFPDNLREAARRYRQSARLAWHQWLAFGRLEEEIGLRRAMLAPVAAKLGLPVLDEPFHHATVARRALRQAIVQALPTAALPAAVTDTDFAQVAAVAWHAEPQQPPGELVRMAALGPAWQTLWSAGKPARRQREAWALVRGPEAWCTVVWLLAEQAAVASAKPGWGPVHLRVGDDVRFVKCPG
jgi:hypothetical protein